MYYPSRALLSMLFILLVSCNADRGFTEMGVASQCDTAQKSCTVVAGEAAVNLRLGPGVVPLQPFNAVVKISGIEVDPNSVITDFQMEGMDMGLNRYRMVGDNGKWTGTVTLPVCSASRMDWIALVEFTSNGVPYRARFPFATDVLR